VLDVPARAAPPAFVSRLAGRRGAIAAAVAVVVVLFLIIAALAGGKSGGGAGPDGLAGKLSDLAARVEEGNGAKGPDAAERLRAVAEQLQAGGGGDAAGELARDAYAWNQSGQLSGSALREMLGLLGRVPGVDPTALTTTTTTAPPPTTAAPPPPREGGRGKGHGKED